MRLRNFLVATVFIMAVAIFFLCKYNKGIRSERDRYRADTEALLTGVQEYKIIDSLNAVKVLSLELTNKEMMQHIKDDAELIKALRGRNKELQGYAQSVTSTKDSIFITMRDTIIQRDSIHEASCIDLTEKWIDIHGCIIGGFFKGYYEARDSLILVESVKRARFLGFLWKTKRIKERSYQMVSKNPNTKIIGFEVVIKKE